jgi:hypothetical protein
LFVLKCSEGACVYVCCRPNYLPTPLFSLPTGRTIAFTTEHTLVTKTRTQTHSQVRRRAAVAARARAVVRRALRPARAARRAQPAVGAARLCVCVACDGCSSPLSLSSSPLPPPPHTSGESTLRPRSQFGQKRLRPSCSYVRNIMHPQYIHCGLIYTYTYLAYLVTYRC